MHLNFFLFILLLFLLSASGAARPDMPASLEIKILEPANLCTEVKDMDLNQLRPSPLLKAFRNKQQKDKKIVAALLAFPFPFGIVGLHRIYLGCAPYVPVTYIASLGGVFGILPLIDFCVLLYEKNLDKYINNKKIFMWIN